MCKNHSGSVRIHLEWISPRTSQQIELAVTIEINPAGRVVPPSRLGLCQRGNGATIDGDLKVVQTSQSIREGTFPEDRENM